MMWLHSLGLDLKTQEYCCSPFYLVGITVVQEIAQQNGLMRRLIRQLHLAVL